VTDFQDVDPNKIENIKPDKLIYFKGRLEISKNTEPLGDRELLVTKIPNVMQLARSIEMYQWVDMRD
jgi:hypothetical protein